MAHKHDVLDFQWLICCFGYKSWEVNGKEGRVRGVGVGGGELLNKTVSNQKIHTTSKNLLLSFKTSSIIVINRTTQNT